MTLEGLKRCMERFEVDAAVISVGPPGGFLGDAGAAVSHARRANDGIAEIVREQPQRFAGLATLPLPDLGAAVTELERCDRELGLDGVMLFSNVAGTYLGDRALEPLLAALDEQAAYVFVHPGFPPDPPPLPHPVWLYEFPFETVRATVNLIYSGAFERYPQIRWQLSHLGGAAPFLARRIASLAEREPDQVRMAPAGALKYLARLYYDTGLSNDAAAVSATREVAGLDHIVFGTDWPYAVLPEQGRDPAPELGFLGSQRARVDAGNAAVLVPRFEEPLEPDS